MHVGKKVEKKLSTPQYSFLRGYKQLSATQQILFDKQAMELLNYTSKSTYRKRVLGKWQVLHRAVAMKAIENLFHEYGITDVWGI